MREAPRPHEAVGDDRFPAGLPRRSSPDGCKTHLKTASLGGLRRRAGSRHSRTERATASSQSPPEHMGLKATRGCGARATSPRDRERRRPNSSNAETTFRADGPNHAPRLGRDANAGSRQSSPTFSPRASSTRTRPRAREGRDPSGDRRRRDAPTISSSILFPPRRPWARPGDRPPRFSAPRAEGPVQRLSNPTRGCEIDRPFFRSRHHYQARLTIVAGARRAVRSTPRSSRIQSASRFRAASAAETRPPRPARRLSRRRGDLKSPARPDAMSCPASEGARVHSRRPCAAHAFRPSPPRRHVPSPAVFFRRGRKKRRALAYFPSPRLSLGLIRTSALNGFYAGRSPKDRPAN